MKREKLGEDEQADWGPLRTYLRGKRSRKQKRRIMQAVWGNVPTYDFLHRAGFAVTRFCLCGQVDTIDHRRSCFLYEDEYADLDDAK